VCTINHGNFGHGTGYFCNGATKNCSIEGCTNKITLGDDYRVCSFHVTSCQACAIDGDKCWNAADENFDGSLNKNGRFCFEHPFGVIF